MKNAVRAVCLAAVVAVLGSGASAVNIQTVPVGNIGNAGELSGKGAGGWGPDRICGAVAYEYKIGKYEVTAGQYTEFLNAVAATDTYGLYNRDMDRNSFGCQITRNGTSGNYTYDFSGRPGGEESDWVNRPVNYVSWGDAARFANWLHNGQPIGAQGLATTEDGAYFLNGAVTYVALRAISREADWKWAIPTEDEWYKAAYHKNDGVTDNYFNYATSSDTTPGWDMTEVTNPGNNANYYGSEHEYPIDSPHYRTLAGEFELSDSPYGTFDQGGNVWEWNEEIVGTFDYRNLRGASFADYSVYLHASDRNVGGSPEYHSYALGFRVVEVPEPATLSLLALGALGVLRRKRRR